jgi:hypothetical protein
MIAIMIQIKKMTTISFSCMGKVKFKAISRQSARKK